MNDSPGTRASLLLRVRDAGDGPAWSQFVDIYGPLVYGYVRRRGLQDADAADLTQEVLARVSQAIRGLDYDPERGSFRGWLFTVVRNTLTNYLRRRKRHEQGSGDSEDVALLHEQPAPEVDDLWDSEFKQRLFTWAANQVRTAVEEATWQAFWLTSVEGRAAMEVARSLDMSVAAVYMAKSRVLARIKDLVHEAENDETRS